MHCHDDLGLATANALAALTAGARRVECTVNGIGERAGNTSLEEIVMLLRVRQSRLGLECAVDPKEITRASRLVAELTGTPVQPNKAVVGANAFAHAAGIHQDGILKDRLNYEIMKPEDVGLADSKIVLTARSGRHAFHHRLGRLGVVLTEAQTQAAWKRFKEVADVKREVTDEDLRKIVTAPEGRGFHRPCQRPQPRRRAERSLMPHDAPSARQRRFPGRRPRRGSTLTAGLRPGRC